VLWPFFKSMFQDNPFQQQFTLNQYGSQLTGGSQQGYATTTTSPFYYSTPTIQIVPVPVPQQEQYDAKKAVQVIYRFNKGLVQACLIKGTMNPEYAKNVFLGQFDGDEPEIVAAVEVALAG